MARDIAQEIINAVKAKAPDYTITKLMQEREDKIKSEGLSGKVPGTDTIVSYAKSLLSTVTGGGNTVVGGADPVIKPAVNGVVELAPDPLFNPNEYIMGGNASYGTASGTTNSTASSGLNKIIGYVVVGLVGIALLDKFVSGKGR